MTPLIIRAYLHAYLGKFISPGLSMLPSQYIRIPRQTLFALCVQACNSKNFEPDATTGYAPAANQVSLADYTGTPILAIKTYDDWKAETDAFAASFSGYLSLSWHSLSAGRFVIGGTIEDDVTADLDYVIQARLLDASNNPLYLPIRPPTLFLEEPVILGTEPGTPAATILYSGTLTFAAGESAKAVTIAGLTTAAVVLLQQKDTGAGITTFLPACTTNTLTVNAGSAAPAETWSVGYQVVSL